MASPNPTHETIWLSLLKGGATRQYRDMFASALKEYLNNHVSSHHNESYSSLALGISRNIYDDGICVIDPVFSSDQISSIKSKLKNLKANFYNANGAQLIAYDYINDAYESDSRVHYAKYPSADLLEFPEIKSLVHNPLICQIASSYLGCIPTLSSVTCWWSYPGRKTAGAQFFHQDRGDFASLNLFVYLSDVDLENGPHVFCKKTHTFELLSQFAQDNLDLITSQLFWSWWEKHRKSDNEVKTFFDPYIILGSNGTSFFEDTRGLHKGKAPTKEKRLVFELVWTLMPQFNSTLKPTAKYAKKKADATAQYINRMAYQYV